MSTYGGGFLLGVKRAGGTVLGDIPTWDECMPFANLIGINHVKPEDFNHADVVVGNPPCSRFSAMSYSAFNENDRTNINAFCDLTAVLDLGVEKKARVIHWENGPIACTKGRDIIVEAHRRVHAKTTLVLKFDLPWTGTLQRRPRTHVIHFMDPCTIKGLPGPIKETRPIKAWVDSHFPKGKVQVPVTYERYYPMEDPIGVVAHHESIGGFRAMKPRAVNETQRWSPSLVSGRQHAWIQENRWWSIAEYAAIQAYPVDLDYETLLGKPWHRVTTYMSKSVSPAASKWLFEHVITCAVNFGKVIGETPVQQFDSDENIWFAKLVVPGQSKEIL
jgi:site-specific DNA-cytosine methylase